ncbi:hypothetical protein GE061_011624 [Apolygus lucorum]|uniref:Uncharacterized protein n=1 Tax=Apolygus lucorum TaxID=248454 RepID=A0A6A4KAR1_APOLU|nr:hypothetical protein GE061_011624 [Apolygus lucorum]
MSIRVRNVVRNPLDPSLFLTGDSIIHYFRWNSERGVPIQELYFIIIMKKQQKKKNPFKVDHVRSIKMKAKAKQYTGQLKQLKCVVSDKVKSTNEQLAVLEDVVRQGPKKEVENSDTHKDITTRNEKVFQTAIDQYNQSQKTEADALDKLSNWTCK